MSNLVLIRTLIHSTDPDVRKPLQKMLILECLRNKDRMVVEPIVRLTRPELVEILNQVSLVVHLCWRSAGFRSLINKVFCGSVLALDYEFNSPCPRLLTQEPRSNFEMGGGGAPLVTQYWGVGDTGHFFLLNL